MQNSKELTKSPTLQWSGSTDQGKFRPNNEDAFLGLQFDAREVHHLGKHGDAKMINTDFVFAVSDGMGGARAGEYASKIAVEKITSLLPRSFNLSALGLEAGCADVLAELFAQIHRALAYLGSSYEECAGMEATLSLAWFSPGWMYFAHIGDSRIYYLSKRDGGIKQLTHDDTHVGWLFRKGEINEREAREHPRRHVLQKALGGSNQFVDPQVGAVAYEPGDIFLLCTDGLFERIYDKEFLEILRAPGSAKSAENFAQRLVTESIHKNSRDNATALVVRVA
ncbi:MAG: protein phosphatase 2C domain-containing protein [Verrucomicrobiota bacterium]